MEHLKKLLLFSLFAATISGCNKQNVANVPHPLSNEFLTTTALVLQNTSLSSDKPMVALGIVPPDTNTVITAGNAGSASGYNTLASLIAPIAVTTAPARTDTLLLKAHSTYNSTVFIFDQTHTPADTVSDVVKQRENIHLFVYFPSPGLNLTDSITDHDANVPPLPLGLQSNIKTGAAGAGTLRLVLRHQPNVKDGTYGPGSSDLDITFPVRIK